MRSPFFSSLPRKGRKTYKFVGAVQITPRTVVRLCPETVYTGTSPWSGQDSCDGAQAYAWLELTR